MFQTSQTSYLKWHQGSNNQNQRVCALKIIFHVIKVKMVLMARLFHILQVECT